MSHCPVENFSIYFIISDVYKVYCIHIVLRCTLIVVEMAWLCHSFENINIVSPICVTCPAYMQCFVASRGRRKHVQLSILSFMIFLKLVHPGIKTRIMCLCLCYCLFSGHRYAKALKMKVQCLFDFTMYLVYIQYFITLLDRAVAFVCYVSMQF